MRWYRYIAPEDAEWLWNYAESHQLNQVLDELERLANTVNPW